MEVPAPLPGRMAFLSAIRWLTPPANFRQAFGFERIAVAERVSRALEELQERLKPTTTVRLEEYVTKHFIAIADRRFRNGKIRLPAGGAPEIEMDGGDHALLEMLSGFEKRSFGIAFSLALAEITRRRIPLVIDTPIPNTGPARSRH